MKWREIVLALIRCELKAGYCSWSGWQVSAKGALPIVILALVVFAVHHG
jgi:hypothetical protein